MTSGDFRPGFVVLHGNRLEDLFELLCSQLKNQPLAPLESEVILLQSNAMKHWLELALAQDSALGICAATRMELPASYLWQLYRSVLGEHVVPEQMPFDPPCLLWRLLRLLPAWCQNKPIYQPLQRYLDGASPARKRYQLARQLADVFDGYQHYRADWLSDWAAGRDLLRSATGLSQPLPAEQSWQAQLWRDLLSDTPALFAEASRADVQRKFLHALATLDAPTGRRTADLSMLPKRLIVFGISALPRQTVQVLAALGAHIQVLLLVQNPCRHFWADLSEDQELANPLVAPPDDAAADLAGRPARGGHALLASWGKLGRDYVHLLDDFEQRQEPSARAERVNLFVDPLSQSQSQLAQLQSDIFNLHERASKVQSDDGSLIFVSAHSAQRELEVLHDRLLGWFDADADLQPREVMVMVPDMAKFAAPIQAVFGRFAPGQERYIPFTVADTTQRHGALVQALEVLLKMPESRLTLADWLGLFELPALRRRFGLDAAAVQTLLSWLSAAGVRWGLDATQRARCIGSVPSDTLAQNSWASGLRRLLLGYALGPAWASVAGAPATASPEPVHTPAAQTLDDASDGMWQGILPQPALSGLDAALIAGLLDWLSATEETLVLLQAEHTPEQWGSVLTNLLARFFCASDDADESTLARLQQTLEAWQEDCRHAQFDSVVPLEVVREHWLAQLETVPLGQRFFGVGVQFASLLPMRAIPFKVVALLGLNDADYPRASAARDFDLMARNWRAGDRSHRADDRYLFLQALLSARQRFYLSWQGHSANDNSPRAASVLVAQLLDYVNQCWKPPRRAQVQPLQAFSSAYFSAGSGFTSYAADWQRASNQASNDPPCSAPTPAPCPLAPCAPAKALPSGASQPLTLAKLQRLLRQPVEVFLRDHLQVEFAALGELEQEDERFSLNALQRYQAGASLLEQGASAPALRRLKASGDLPLAGFGEQAVQGLMEQSCQVLALLRPWQQRYPCRLDPVSIAFTLDPTPTERSERLTDASMQSAPLALHDTLNELWQTNCVRELAATPDLSALAPEVFQFAARTGTVLQTGTSGVRAHVLLNLWVRHLAGCASGMRLTSVQFGSDGQVVLKPMAPAAALRVLRRLAQAYQSAWAAPLPLGCKTALAYLQTQLGNAQLRAAGKAEKDPDALAREVFSAGYGNGEREQSDYLQRVFENYDAIAQELPKWAKTLYGDLFANLEHSSTLALQSK